MPPLRGSIILSCRCHGTRAPGYTYHAPDGADKIILLPSRGLLLGVASFFGGPLFRELREALEVFFHLLGRVAA